MHANFQNAEGCRKRYLRHRSLDFASSLIFYSNSDWVFVANDNENRHKSSVEDLRPLNLHFT